MTQISSQSPIALGPGWSDNTAMRAWMANISAQLAQLQQLATATYPAQSSGWGTPTGGAVQNDYSGSSATLAETSAALAQIIIALKAVGILGS